MSIIWFDEVDFSLNRSLFWLAFLLPAAFDFMRPSILADRDLSVLVNIGRIFMQLTAKMIFPKLQ